MNTEQVLYDDGYVLLSRFVLKVRFRKIEIFNARIAIRIRNNSRLYNTFRVMSFIK